MGLSNLPDDWGAYYSKCSTCGGRNHASGTDECACHVTYDEGCKECGGEFEADGDELTCMDCGDVVDLSPWEADCDDRY